MCATDLSDQEHTKRNMLLHSYELNFNISFVLHMTSLCKMVPQVI